MKFSVKLNLWFLPIHGRESNFTHEFSSMLTSVNLMEKWGICIIYSFNQHIQTSDILKKDAAHFTIVNSINYTNSNFIIPICINLMCYKIKELKKILKRLGLSYIWWNMDLELKRKYAKKSHKNVYRSMQNGVFAHKAKVE